MDKPRVLPVDSTLVGHDLTSVYWHFKKADDAITMGSAVQFKKKEDVDKMAKSILKHRIQTLTGKSLPTIEHQLGIENPAETSMEVGNLRRLAKLLILEAMALLPPKGRDEPVKRKMPPSPPKEAEPRGKKSRRSIAPVSNVVKTPRKSTRKSLAPETLRNINLGSNPTPQMLALKAKFTGNKKVEEEKVKLFFPGEDNSRVYLSKCDLLEVGGVNGMASKLESLRSAIDDFEGADLSVLHTPVKWDAAQVLNLTMAVRSLNRKSGLEHFLVLIGCGLTNVKLFREALFRQTKHVQFVVFERQDQGLSSVGSDTMLRDTNSYFLLAYFFPGCEDEANLPPNRMVRAGATTCFHTKSTEDLENSILHTLSEKGDWILDICCAGRELSLAAQKSGRNAVAVDPSSEKLRILGEKASAIGTHYSTAFRQDKDGVILEI